MVLPRWLARANRAVTNPLLRSLVGVGWMAELEHTGRSSNRRYRTVLMVFGRGDAVTVALTYGPGVDWLKNLRAAGGGRLRLGRELLALGPPRRRVRAWASSSRRARPELGGKARTRRVRVGTAPSAMVTTQSRLRPETERKSGRSSMMDGSLPIR